MLPELECLDRVMPIARAAGAIVMEVYATSFQVATKADASPVTEADLVAHRLIVAALGELTPQLPVLSEEQSQVPWAERARWPRYWLVDPLDGTREFVSRNGEFTVNIALVDGHVPVLGVVHVPVSDISYLGLPGTGAWRRHGEGSAVVIHAATAAATPLRVVGSRSHRGDSLAGFLERVGAHELIAIGSSLKFCRVAEGTADVYPRLGPSSEWDTAAGHAVVAAAGGTVSRLDGAPLEYNTRAELLNPLFVAYGPTDRDWCVLLRGGSGGTQA